MFDKLKDMVTGGRKGKDLGDARLGGYEKYVQGITWPASKEEVITALRENGADDALIAHVESLAGDRFSSAADIFKGVLK